MTAIRPAGRYGALSITDDNRVDAFHEKRLGDGGYVSGGFFVFEPQIFDYISGDQTYLEREPLEKIAQEKQLIAYKYEGFWQSMDTLRDKKLLEEMWSKAEAPWKLWE